jgi:hypothetical protein
MNKFNLSLKGATVVALGLLLAPIALSIPAQAKPTQAAPAKPGAKTTKKTVYVCPMHSDVVSLKPGKCPKCKMTLVKKSVAVLYTCSMHPEVLSLKPGKCPKCNMTLVKRK